MEPMDVLRPAPLPGPDGTAAPVDLRAELPRLFGFASFRPGQEDLVRRALEGRSCLAVLPTGSGKSLCYQLPAMLRPTPTLVVSPLIALMQDQVDHAPAALRNRVTLINSTLDPEEAAARLQGLVSGRIRLLYAAPERLRQARFTDALRVARVGLVVVDEAHCVALWGHDFRPDYLFIRAALAGPLREAAVLALTATATPATADEIRAALGRPDMEVVRRPVVRGNLRYEVLRLGDEEDKLRCTLELAARSAGAGIVYVRARQRCERVAELLRRAGVAAAAYHAGLEREERAGAQADFLAGRLRVVVATTAFGMGVDKPDIRWVLLYNYPTSLEEFVQQTGRAGRDGAPSVCTLLATTRDAQNLRTFARRDAPDVEELRRVWSALRAASLPSGAVAVAPSDLAVAAALPEGKDARVHCGVLERAGLLERQTDTGGQMRLHLLPPPPDAPARIAGLVSRMAEAAAERTLRMVAFAESQRCRHEQVAAHFGDRLDPPCARCDVCAPQPGPAVSAPRAAPPPPAHPEIAILDAVTALRWPLGRSGLVAMLRGSVATPPSARGSPAFGILAAVPAGTLERWIDALVASGNLVRQETEGGYPVLVPGRRSDLPEFTAPAPRAPRSGRRRGAGARLEAGEEPLEEAAQERFAALRAWRAEQARAAGVPPYVILHDRTLREIARRRPATLEDLAEIPGIGTRRLATHGEPLLALLAERGG